MNDLERLCEAVRTISTHGDVQLRPVPGTDALWVCVVRVGNVVLEESTPGTVPEVVGIMVQRILGMSLKVKAYLDSPDAQ